MTAIAELEILHRIAMRHGFVAHANLIEKLISLAASDPDGIWNELSTNDVWGGSGSLADVSISSYSSLPEAEVRIDERAWRNAFIKLNERMGAHGVHSSRADSWTATFQSWNDAGVGI